MGLEALICEFLKSQKEITDSLAEFQSEPAIFYQRSPEDSVGGADGESQYPRLEFTIAKQADAKPGNAGRMQVTILCEDSGILPEEIGTAVRSACKELFLKPDDGSCVCLAWMKTDDFQFQKSYKWSGTDTYRFRRALVDMESRIIGCELWFDILEYPLQLLTDPDPAMACAAFLRQQFPECLNVSYDNRGSCFKADSHTPAFYFRLMDLKRSRETNTVVWLDARIAVHIFAPGQEARLKWITEFSNRALLDGAFPMLDGSPMRITGMEVNHGADYMAQGQIIMSVQYGLLRYKAKPHRITSINISVK